MAKIKWFSFGCRDCDVPMEPRLKPGDRDVEVTCPECGQTYLASYPSEMMSPDADALGYVFCRLHERHFRRLAKG